jgi:hypothetical protein
MIPSGRGRSRAEDVLVVLHLADGLAATGSHGGDGVVEY